MQMCSIRRVSAAVPATPTLSLSRKVGEEQPGLGYFFLYYLHKNHAPSSSSDSKAFYEPYRRFASSDQEGEGLKECLLNNLKVSGMLTMHGVVADDPLPTHAVLHGDRRRPLLLLAALPLQAVSRRAGGKPRPPTPHSQSHRPHPGMQCSGFDWVID